MAEQSKWHSRAIILISFLMLCGLWLLVLQQVGYEREKELEKAAVGAKNLTKAFEEQVHSIVASADNDMLTIQQAYEQEGPTSPIIAALLEQIRKDSAKIQGGITNERGIFVASSAPQALPLDYSDRKWFLTLRENSLDSLYISQTEVSKMSGKSAIPLSRRLSNPDGSFAGVVHISFSLEYFDDVVKKLELGSNGVLSINRMDGINLLRKTQDSQDSGQNVRSGAVWKRAQVTPYGTLIARGAVDGVERLFSYRVMQDYPLLIVVGSSTETLLVSFEQRKRNYFLGAIGVSFIIAGLCYLLIDRIRKQRAEMLRLSRNTEIQTVLREIADAAVLASSLDELYATVHRLIRRVLPAENFYISLLDEKYGLVIRPYCVDETNSVPIERPIGKGLTEYFMRMGRSVHMTSALFAKLRETGAVDLYMAPVFECLGAPLRDGQGKSFGAITIFVDDDFLHFQAEDVELLSIIAAQVSMAIERKQAEHALKAANESLECRVEERTQEIEAANEELTAQNEEIASMNEEIMSLNHNLMTINDALEIRVAERTSDLLVAQEELTAQLEELEKTQSILKASEDKLNRAQAIAHVGNWEIAIGSDQAWVSAEVLRIYGIEQETPYISFKSAQKRVCKEDRQRLDRALKFLVERDETYDLEFKITQENTGLERTIHSIAEIERNQAGIPVKIIGVVQDITERKLVEEALVEKEARYRAVLEQAPEAVLLCDLDTGDVMETNSRFVELTGYDLQRQGKLNLFDLIVDTAKNIGDDLDRLQQNGRLPMQRRKLNHSSSRVLDVERSATVVRYRGRKLFVMTIRDVSEELRRAREDHFLAIHDELTGLYNHRGFAEAVELFLEAGKGGALLLIDIDDFKIINDANGHEGGDQCLTAMATYLRENFGEAAVLARFVGDEFVLFFAGTEGLAEAIRAYNSMEVICLETSMGAFFIQLSAGLSVFAEQESELELQVQKAYLAMHHAKENGKWCYKQYETALQEKVGRRYAIKKALNNALAGNEFYLVFQPIFDIRKPGKNVAGYEALLRWTSPRIGMVSPMEFIPVAEETNLIIPIGEWVLREACLFLENLQKMQGCFSNVAVNVSMRQLAMPSFVDMVKRTLRETGLPAENLNLEVTESILMTDAETRIGYLQDLRDIGVSISLDDFGTGYSSFTHLTQMPITTLKIDKYMVDGIMEAGKSKKLLLESLLQMSALLGYDVIAEGVETEEQLAFLKSKGCDYCQGYLLSPPLSEAAVTALAFCSD